MKCLGNGMQTIGWQIEIFTRHHQCVNKIRNLNLAPQTAELAIEKLHIELRVVADYNRPSQPLHEDIGDGREFWSGGQFLVRETVGASCSNRERTFGIHESLHLLLDAFPLGEHNADFTNAVTEPRRKSGRFEVQKSKTGTGEIKHRVCNATFCKLNLAFHRVERRLSCSSKVVDETLCPLKSCASSTLCSAQRE